MDDMIVGVVKWFNEGKGLGFIAADGRDYFVHFKDIKMDGYKRLEENQGVKFVAVKRDKGWSATQVTVIV